MMKLTCHIIGYIIAAFLIVSLNSCLKKELPVPHHDPGPATTATVDLGSPYTWQIYFSLKNNTIAGQNQKTAWDIAFEPTPGGYHTVLNAAKSMFAYNTGKTNFTEVTYQDTTGFGANKKWDAPSGRIDSTAIGDWRTTMPVYIIDRGYNEAGAWLGLEKLQLLSVTDTNYIIRFAAMNGTGDTTLLIKKDSAYNLVFASFSSRAQVVIEPPKDSWDIAFSQYTYIFYDYDPPMPYLVTGCLLNRNGTSAIKDTAMLFAQIGLNDVSNMVFSQDISTIGYNWKTYVNGNYNVNPNGNYIVRTTEGRYYKLHFIGYYNLQGAEGNPKWEYQEL